MQSSLIGKIDKAKRYAQERDRARIQQLNVAFHGENGDHQVTFSAGVWGCSCDFFQGHETCSHTMALEQILDGMLPVETGVQQ